MSLKGSRTTADYLPWNEMLLLIQKLERDNQTIFALLIAVGSYTGLRISDLRKLHWKDVLDTDRLTIVEQKTGKTREIHLHQDLKEILSRVWGDGNFLIDQAPFLSRNKEVYSLQYVNRRLKKIALDYKLNIRFSTHTFRKTFGRRIWSQNNYSERSLILLGQVFNHSSVAITKRYLGIREEEIKDVYLTL